MANRTVFKPGRRKSGGRKRGTPNKFSAPLKEAILEAATLAGGEDGLVGYLRGIAKENHSAFAGLLGKVLPLTLAADDGAPVRLEVSWLPPSDKGAGPTGGKSN